MLWAAQLLEREWRRGSAALSAPGAETDISIARREPQASVGRAELGDVARCSGHGSGTRVHPSGRSRNFPTSDKTNLSRAINPRTLLRPL